MKKISFTLILLLISVSVYLFTRLWKIEEFPIYFFSDEAIQAVKAEELINNHFKDNFGTLLPPFFKNFYNYNLGLSVYLNLPAVFLFGKTIWAVRGTTALISLLGSIFTALLLKQVFKLKNYWSSILFLALTPVFFLHTRTGFETAIATSFYAGFLYFYLLYRKRSRKFMGLAITFATLTFYSYAGIWLMILVSGLIFAVVDFPYHIKNLRILILGLIYTLILFSPFIRFTQNHKEIIDNHLQWYRSYLVKDVPLTSKAGQFIENYKLTFTPNFLFVYDKSYFVRHYLKGYGYFSILTLPFILLGLLYLLIGIKKPAERIILLSILISPLGGVLIEPSPTRFLPLVITLAVTFGLGIKLLENIIVEFTKQKVVSPVFSVCLFALLSFLTLYTTFDTVTNGHLWFKDYGLYGMQYGAKQIFQDTLPKYLASFQTDKIMVTPNWANGSEIYPLFFLSPKDRERIEIKNIDFYTREKRDAIENNLFVMMKSEYEKTAKSPYFTDIEVKEILKSPDGTPAFYMVKLKYAKDVDSVFAHEAEMRKIPDEGEVTLDGQTVKIIYSKLGDGQIKNLFDNNTKSLIRGLDANPYSLTITFPAPRDLKGLSLDLGSMNFEVNLTLFRELDSNPNVISHTYTKMPDDPHLDIYFEKQSVRKIRVEIKNINRTDTAEIHIRELKFL